MTATDEGRVRVDFRSVGGAWQTAQRLDFWVLLRTKDNAGDAFRQAIDDANELDSGNGAFAELDAQSPDGYVFLVSGFADDKHLNTWFANLAGRLSARGLRGVLEGAHAASSPAWIAADHAPTPTLFLSWTRDPRAVASDVGNMGTWQVPDAATHAIARHIAEWTEPGGDRIILYDSTFPFAVSHSESIADTLGSSVTRSGMSAVVRSQQDQRRARMASLAPGGETVMQALDENATWQDQISALRAAMTALPHYLEQAFIRPAAVRSIGWLHIATSQKLNGLREYDLRYNRHLLGDYVPDAHGIQVLTTDHLRRARDLSSWRISSLGVSRHLVEAEELEPWYGVTLPELDVVARARHDFGEMILTKEVIAANPPPRN